VSLKIEVSDTGSVTGDGAVSATTTLVGSSGCSPPIPAETGMYGCDSGSPNINGTASSFGFTCSHPGLQSTSWRYDFTGALNGAEVTGVFSLTITAPQIISASTAFPVRLR
jgi:hypothetical protein